MVCVYIDVLHVKQYKYVYYIILLLSKLYNITLPSLDKTFHTVPSLTVPMIYRNHPLPP